MYAYVKRAIQTVTQVYNAKFNENGSIHQLPGPGDLTLSIFKASVGAGPSVIRLSVRFSVYNYNLEKAREVLLAQGVTFKEQSLEDGSAELGLAPEQPGYPTSPCQAPAREPSNDSFSSSTLAFTSVVVSVHQLDPDASKIKIFHERMLGFPPLRTFTLSTVTTVTTQLTLPS